MEKIIYCADVIARMGDSGLLVFVERLGSAKGIGFPGGKSEPGESLSETAKREFREETGLALEIDGVLGTYAEENRDPRGRYVSTVFYGRATGKSRGERDKTRVRLMAAPKALIRKDEFAFDHYRMLEDYVRLT